MVRWAYDPHLYGIPIDLTDTGHEYYYRDDAVSTDEEWLDSVGLGLLVSLDSGFRTWARRRRVDDYIELRAEGGWPTDSRFRQQSCEASDQHLAATLLKDGLDPSVALELSAHGRLLVWLVTHENNSTGHPFVGQAVVASAERETATLLHVQACAGVPDHVRLGLAYTAVHAAAEAGAQRITTTLTDTFLDIAGFRLVDGVRSIDPSFLDADPDAVRALRDASLAEGRDWGSDRDIAGRYLPGTRVGQLLHVLRRGPSGRSATRRHRAH